MEPTLFCIILENNAFLHLSLLSLSVAAVLNTSILFSNGFQGAPTPIRTSLRVSPDRSQFFRYELIYLGCEEEQRESSTGKWKVKRRLKSGQNGTCKLDWGSKTETQPCRIGEAYAEESGVYWCESVSGERSTAVNITVTEGAVILESPFLPVTEGQNVALRCLHKISKDVYQAQPGFFYKDGALIGAEPTGEMTLFHVSSLDEGLYRCSNSDLVESPESWLVVRASPSANTNSSSPSSSFSSPLLPPLVGAGVALLFVILLVVVVALRVRRKRKITEEPSISEDVTYANVLVDQDLGRGTMRERAVPEPSDYSTLTAHAVYSTACGVGVSNHQRKPQSKRETETSLPEATHSSHNPAISAEVSQLLVAGVFDMTV